MESDVVTRVRATQLLSKSGLSCEEATEFTEYIGNMASRNIIERFEAKIDAQTQKYTQLKWVIGIVGSLLIALIVALLNAVLGLKP